MDSYILAIYATLEQEVAVRQLFLDKGWNFKKYDGFYTSFPPDFAGVKPGAGPAASYRDPFSVDTQPVFPGYYPAVRPVTTGPYNYQDPFQDTMPVDWSQKHKPSVSSCDYNKQPSCENNKQPTCDNNKQQALDNKPPGQSLQPQETTSTSPPKKDASQQTDETRIADPSNIVDPEVLTKLAEMIDDSLAPLPKTTVVKQEEVDLPVEDVDDEMTEIEEYEEVLPKKKKKKLVVKLGKKGYKIKNKKKKKEKTTKTKTIKTKTKTSNILVTAQKQKRKYVRTKNCFGSYHCNDCNFTFKLLGSFKNHKKDGICVFECEHCGRKFTSRHYANYKSHVKRHTSDRVHHCDLCDKSYKDMQTLQTHIRRHKGDRPYVCDVCGKAFYCASNLKYHKQSYHAPPNTVRKMYKCHICPAELSSRANLRNHVKIVHTEERPFTCEVCGKTFKTKKSLETFHSRVHSTVYPFKCTVVGCEKAFKRSESFKDHMRRHKNDRSHFCETCGKGFFHNKDLKVHMRVHTGVKPYSCSQCEYRCSLGSNLNKHMKTHLSSSIDGPGTSDRRSVVRRRFEAAAPPPPPPPPPRETPAHHYSNEARQMDASPSTPLYPIYSRAYAQAAKMNPIDAGHHQVVPQDLRPVHSPPLLPLHHHNHPY